MMTDLSVLPLSVHFRRSFSELFQQFFSLLGICFQEIVVYSPCIASILLEKGEIIMPVRAWRCQYMKKDVKWLQKADRLVKIEAQVRELSSKSGYPPVKT